MASAGARACNGALGGAEGRAPSGGQGASPPESAGILVLEHKFLRCLGTCIVADLTEATKQRRTFDTDAILSVND